MNMINPYTVTIAFAAVLAGLAAFRPKTGRVVAGVFFLVMALGVNIPIALIDPGLFAAAGANALLPVYRWFFGQVLASYPLPFVVALILFEVSTGLLILSQGKAVRVGLVFASLFCLFIAPVGVEELPAPFLAIAFLVLLRQEFPRPVVRLARAPRAA